MSISRQLLVGISMVLAVGLAACDKKSEETKVDSPMNNSQVENDKDHMANDMDQSAQKLENKMDNKVDKVGDTIDDAGITAKVKAAIFAEPGLKSLQISVDTIQNVTTLTGTVDSQQNSDRAREIAAAVEGVKSIQNNLVVKSTS